MAKIIVCLTIVILCNLICVLTFLTQNLHRQRRYALLHHSGFGKGFHMSLFSFDNGSASFGQREAKAAWLRVVLLWMREQVGDEILNLCRYDTSARDQFAVDHVPHDRELRIGANRY